MKKIILLLILGSAIISCKTVKPTGDKNSVVLSGKIQKPGMTTYQYGTHVLKEGDKTYALKSTSVNLDEYLDKEVSVKGVKVEGYPVENGPELIEVKEVTVK